MDKLKSYLKKIYLPKGLCLMLLLIPIVYCFCANCYLNNDSWFLFNYGSYVLENGFPTIEPFTMHENFSFVMQQWLSAIIFYLTYSNLGKIGLALLVTLVFTLILFLIYKLCLLISKRNNYLSYILVAISSILLITYAIGSRPQIFSYVNFLLLFYFLESYIQKKDIRYLIPLPLISLLEINMHAATWGLLFCFILPYIIESFYLWLKKQETYHLKPLIIVTIIMLLAGFINPYGIDAMTYVFKSYGVYEINDFITEMMVPNITTNFGKTVFLTIFAVLFILSFAKKIKIRYIFLMLGLLYLALSAYRNYPLFVIGALLPFADCFKDKFKGIKKNNLPKIHKTLCYIALGLVIVTVIVVSNPVYRLNKPYEMEGATSYLVKHVDKDKAVIYTGYDDGGYLEYYGFKPYIDPRAEVFLKSNNHQKDIFKEYYELQNGYLLPSTFLKRYNFTHFVVEKKDIVRQEISRNDNYKLVYKDKYRYIYEKK